MKILMIEDQRFFADMVVHSLEGLNIEVVENLAGAKAKLSRGGYNLVLVDLSLPDSQGIGTLRELAQYKVPKVVLTARFDISGEVAQYGVCDYIVKQEEGPVGIYERIMFNVAKIEKAKRPRFSAETFSQIRACFERPVELELTTA